MCHASMSRADRRAIGPRCGQQSRDMIFKLRNPPLLDRDKSIANSIRPETVCETFVYILRSPAKVILGIANTCTTDWAD